ncbi:MAG: terminase large subunit domain-containing protein [Nitrososphaerales archaeon]
MQENHETKRETENSMKDCYSQQDLEWALSQIKLSTTKFSIAALGFIPFPYQEQFFNDLSKRIVICAGRQVGKTTISAIKALWFVITNPKTVALIVSRTRRQSGHMFDKILEFVEGSPIIRASVVQKNRTMIKFSNGSKVHALPCGPYGDTIRGKTAHFIIVDEANFVPEIVLTQVATPMLATTNGTLILISSPADKNHFFYQAFNSDSWTKYQFKTSDNKLVSQEYLEQAREIAGETGFRREYLGEFVDETNTYFPMSLLRSAVHICPAFRECPYCNIIQGKVIPTGNLYAGYDPGGLVDPAALVVLQRTAIEEELPRDSGKTKTAKRVGLQVVLAKSFRFTKEQRKAKREEEQDNVYTTFTAEVADIHQKMHFGKLLVDSTGQGRPIVSHCRDLGLPAEGMVFSVTKKEEILSNLKIMLEQHKIVLPDNLELLSHLNCITTRRNSTGNYLFDHQSGTHDDLGYALALAAWAARSTPTVLASFQ